MFQTVPSQAFTLIDTMLELRETGSQLASVRLLLAHGAGAPMDSPFLDTFSKLLDGRSVATTRFEFPYMAARRDGGKKRPPPKAESLVQFYATTLELVRGTMPPDSRLFIGGKSMGGRVASLLADECHSKDLISGLVCLGYPFHPPQKPDQLRTAHLTALRCPALFVQGTRDPFGSQSEVESMSLPPTICFHWAADGDHDLGPRGNSGFTRRGNLEVAADAVAEFVRR